MKILYIKETIADLVECNISRNSQLA